MKRLRPYFPLCLGIWFTVSSALLAQEEDDAKAKLKAIEEKIEQVENRQQKETQTATQAEKDILQLSQKMVTTGRTIQAAELDAARLEDQITQLQEENRTKSQLLDTRRAELSSLISALVSLGKSPPATALIKPATALNTARSAAVMGDLIPKIKTMADRLNTELQAIQTIQTQLSENRFALKNTLERLVGEQNNLEKLREERRVVARTARARARAQERRLSNLASEAKTLKDLITELEKQAAAARRANPLGSGLRIPPPGFDSRPIADARGALNLPAPGKVIRQFGEKDGVSTARGITVAARQGAQIIAPYAGQVVYAGPYRAYGQILIIAHGSNYHSLLAGLGDLFVLPDQWVLAGEPVANLPKDNPSDGSFYLELREKGRPIDPLPWFERETAAN